MARAALGQLSAVEVSQQAQVVAASDGRCRPGVGRAMVGVAADRPGRARSRGPSLIADLYPGEVEV